MEYGEDLVKELSEGSGFKPLRDLYPVDLENYGQLVFCALSIDDPRIDRKRGHLAKKIKTNMTETCRWGREGSR